MNEAYQQWLHFRDLIQCTDYPFTGSEFIEGDYPMLATWDIEHGSILVIVFAGSAVLEMDALEYGQRYIEANRESELAYDLELWTPETTERIEYWIGRDLLTGKVK